MDSFIYNKSLNNKSHQITILVIYVHLRYDTKGSDCT